MSGTVNYRKVVNDLTDVIKELNVGFAPCGEAVPAERSRSQEERQRDAVGVVKALLSALEQASPAAAAAEHGSASQKFSERWWDGWDDEEIGKRSYVPFVYSKQDRFHY